MRKVSFDNKYEGKIFNFNKRTYEDIHGVTLCCVVLNEEKEIVDFIRHHKPYVKNIIIIDGGSVDNTVDLASGHVNTIRRIEFSGHYGNQKNRAIELCETDWVLFVDADERMSKEALENLSKLTDQEEYDCYAFPRKNFIDGTLDTEHYPDFQLRLFRAYARYVRPVHEELVGFQSKKELSDDMAIMHRKGMTRHTARNSAYGCYQTKYLHELGRPGRLTGGRFKSYYREILGE